MELTWLGCAGFKLDHQGEGILLDPYLSRNRSALPVQSLTVEELGPVSHIFVSHGHFDHAMDVPGIARLTGAVVACDPKAAQTLTTAGLDPEQIRVVSKDGEFFEAGSFRARADYSRHVRFDLRLMARTLVQAGRRVPAILPLFRDYPCGQVLSWQIDAGERQVRFFGSAGSDRDSLIRMGEAGCDIALIPLQGHSRICEIGLSHVRHLKPAVVIPHHFDDFYPPLSSTVDIRPFLSGMAKEFPEIRVIVPEMNRSFSL